MPHEPKTRHRLRAATTAVVMLAAAVTGGAQAQAADADLVSVSAEPSGPLAAEMNRLLALQPGGVQVSDNAMAWADGAVVVWPSPGEEHAPAGLGSNVRTDVVDALGLGLLAMESAPASEPAAAAELAGTWRSCTAGYYCFYTGQNYDGTRFQFSSTCSGNASSWGFNNQTSSWVSRNYNKRVTAYDYAGGAHLWTMSPGAMKPSVSSAADNRMSYWTCANV